MSDVAPDLSIVVLSWNTEDLLVACLEAVEASMASDPDLAVEVIVVDNASPQQDAEAIAKIRELLQQFDGGELVLHDENSGYSKGMNICYERARGQWIVVSNPDVEFTPGWIDKLLRHI